MGQEYSVGAQSDDTIPDADRPPVFDPLAGFPNGRKKREMKVSEKEMTQYNLLVWEKDFCAHKLIDLKRCQHDFAPFANWKCADATHSFHQCEYEDALMRMMEFERERRLLLRRKRKTEAMALIQAQPPNDSA